MPSPAVRRGTTAQASSTLVVEAGPITRPKFHPRNVREHDEANLQAIMRSLEAFGQRTPIVLNAKDLVLKGNGTLEAALRLGWKEVQWVRVTHLSPQQELAYMLADNKTTDLSEFNFEGVAGLLRELAPFGGLEATGFADFEVRPLLAGVFTPEDPGAEPEGGHTGLRLAFTVDDAKLVERAVALFNARSNGAGELAAPAVVVALCKEYLRAQVVRKKG